MVRNAVSDGFGYGYGNSTHSNNAEGLKILTLYDKSGPKYHRCLLPLFLMDGVELVVNHTLDDSQLEGIEAVFVNRVIPNTTLNELCLLREKHGFKLIVDFDDHWRLDPDHYLAQTYQYFRATELMEAYIQEADGVTVTHERLADEVRKLTDKPVCILPNGIPQFGQFLTKKTEDKITRLFWAGGITHLKDIEILRNPIKRFNFPVQMVMGGFTENPTWTAMATAFTNGGKMLHKIINSLPVEDYYRAYSLCDIALIPLRDTFFNRYKSNLKILEAANIGAPVIVSRVHPYLDFPEDLVNYVDRQGDWYDHVKYVLKNREQGERLQAYCREHYNFDRINKQRKDFIYGICKGTVKEARGEDHHVAG